MRVGIAHAKDRESERLRSVLLAEGHEVSWSVADGAHALECASRDRPDVILCEVSLTQGKEGAHLIARLVENAQLVVTYAGESQLAAVDRALAAGATACVDLSGLDGNARALRARLATIGKLRDVQPSRVGLNPVVSAQTASHLVLLGASTGGPEALAVLCASLPASLPHALVVVQHIEPDFAASFAESLDGRTALNVVGALEGDAPRPGTVHVAVAPNKHLTLDRHGRFRYLREPSDSLHSPSVDCLFESAALHVTTPGVAVVLTGMGQDGTRGLGLLRRAGWHTIAQSAASSVVFGMPRSALSSGAAVESLAPAAIAEFLLRAGTVGASR